MSRNDKLGRIKQELRDVGVTRYGSFKSEVSKLPDIIHDDEHIVGAIYGNVEGSSAMLLATTKRLVFIDVKPIHVITDDISYQNIENLHVDFGLVYAKVTVITRVKSFAFRYVNHTCARFFINAIEQFSLDTNLNKAQELYVKQSSGKVQPVISVPPTSSAEEGGLLTVNLPTDPEILFLKQRRTAVLSSYGEDGYPYGATVFYFLDSKNSNVLYLITRDSTPTAKNTRKKPKVGLTVTDEENLRTMHIKGHVSIETNIKAAHEFLTGFLKSSKFLPENVIPPVAQIKNGSYLILRLSINSIYLHSYKGIGKSSQ